MKRSEATGIEIAAATAAELDAIVRIDEQTLRSRAAEESYRTELDRPCSWLVVSRVPGDDAVVGFMNFWLVADEAHLLALAIRPDRRRRGHGRALVAYLLATAREHACVHATLEVRRSNEAAQALYGACGFEPVAVRPHYYADGGEDAVVMLLDLSGRRSGSTPGSAD